MARIAVIQTAFPGDVILSTPIFEALKSGGHESVAIVRPSAEPLLRHNPHIMKIISYDKSAGIRAFFETVAEIRSLECEIALIVQKHLRSGLLAVFAGIEKRIGYEIAFGRSLYTQTAPFDRSIHAVKRALALCQPLVRTEGFAPRIFIDERTRMEAETILRAHRIAPTKFAVFAPGSIWATKRWPGYGELARLMKTALGYDIALTGSCDDYEICQRVVSESGNTAINLAGKTDLLLSAAVIERARLVVANDSAPSHIAAAVGTPVAAIFGPTVTRFGFAPYSEKSVVIENAGLYCRPCSPHGPNRCPEKHFRCMKEITAEKVAEQCLKLVMQSNAHR
ncbi:MAG: glycosyltransferase family 9 protein [candidate division Zixibacteria bacterium]|jgi:heptosyltransferase-2|nr:glycosyltransferase family 9 protein [candidate division Zixibacteria bacterium]